MDIRSLSSFGEDARGELYVCDRNDGEVFLIEPATCATVLGDLSGNGLVDGGDIPGFVDALLVEFNPCADLAAPFGINDHADLSAFVTALVMP